MSYIDEVFGPNGIMSKHFPNYEPRSGQIQLARAVDSAIQNQGHLLAEAPTGTGKSVAYSVPAIYHAVVGTKSESAPVSPPPQKPITSRCLLCSRELQDALSQELGIGPICRKKGGYDIPASDEARKTANAILAKLRETQNYRAAYDQLLRIGFEKLAESIYAYFSALDTAPPPKGVDHFEKQRAVIVTANIALQEQIVKKDLPMLAKILPWKFEYSLLKGKNNYLCLDRLENGAPDRGEPPDIARLHEILQWTAMTKTGDKSELPFEPSDKLWGKFSVSSDECHGRECEFFDRCHAENARAQALAAHVVVTNYHMFFADMVVREQTGGAAALLPNYRVAILDEGHKAVDIARDFFGFRITRNTFKWVGGLLNTIDKKALDDAAEKFFINLASVFYKGGYKARLKKNNLFDWSALEDELINIQNSYSDLIEDSADSRTIRKLERRRNKAKLLLRQIKEATNPVLTSPIYPWRPHPDVPIDALGKKWFVNAETGDLGGVEDAMLSPNVFYIEEEKHGVSLCSKPISVASRLKAHLFAATGSVSVTSATLTARNSFELIESSLGAGGAQQLVAESPFRWGEQVLLIIPENIPEPTSPDFSRVSAQLCADVIRLTKGRTLGLFTSYKNLNAAYEVALGTGYRILKQGDGPRTKLVDEFRRDVNSVLLGTESFWAGVDVPGESLSCVYIDKLPFLTPDDPVLDALTEREGSSTFFKYSIPHAIIAFKQGFGRLIRSSTDRGVVVCADKRLITKSYGKNFLDSLPKVARSSNVDDIEEFLK